MISIHFWSFLKSRGDPQVVTETLSSTHTVPSHSLLLAESRDRSGDAHQHATWRRWIHRRPPKEGDLTCLYRQICIYICIYLYNIGLYVYMYIHIYNYIHIYIYICVHIYICTHTHIYIYIHVCVCVSLSSCHNPL